MDNFATNPNNRIEAQERQKHERDAAIIVE